MKEKVDFQEEGYAKFNLTIEIPNSPLSELYLSALAEPNETKANFIKSFKDEQYHSLGLIVNVKSFEVLPCDGKSIKIGLSGEVYPRNVTVKAFSEGEIRVVHLGPYKRSDVGKILVKLSFMQLFLKSLPGEQRLESLWVTRFSLPPNAKLLSPADNLRWNAELGGDNNILAEAYINDTNIILSESTIITEQNVTGTPENLYKHLMGFKTFSINYSTPYQTSKNVKPEENMYEKEEDWAYDWYSSWSGRIEAEFDYGPLHAAFAVRQEISLHGHISLVPFESFEAYGELGSSTTLDLMVYADEYYHRTWEETVWEHTIWSHTFWISTFPVEAKLLLKVNASLDFTAEMRMRLLAEYKIDGRFKAGLKWTSTSGWSPIWEKELQGNLTDLRVPVEAKASIELGPKLMLEFRLYPLGLIGERSHTGGRVYVAFEPYVGVGIEYSPPSPTMWKAYVGFRVDAEVGISILCFSKEYKDELYNKKFYEVNGSLYEAPRKIRNHDVSLMGISSAERCVELGSTVDLNIAVFNAGRNVENVTLYGQCLYYEEFPFKLYPAYAYSIRPIITFELANSSSQYTIVYTPPTPTPILVPLTPNPQMDISTQPILPQINFTLSEPLQYLGSITIPNGTSTTFIYKWNTTNLKPGFYVWIINATIINDEFPLDNEIKSDTISVLIIGDVAVNISPSQYIIYKTIPSQTIAYKDIPIKLNVTLVNKKMLTQNVTLEIYYNTTVYRGTEQATEWIIYNAYNITLQAYETKMLPLNISTEDLKVGYTYFITVSAKIPFDMNMTDNAQAIKVKVKMIGDVNGDEIVDMKDILAVVRAFGSYPEHPRWDVDADINFDGKISIFDVVLVAINFGKTCP